MLVVLAVLVVVAMSGEGGWMGAHASSGRRMWVNGNYSLRQTPQCVKKKCARTIRSAKPFEKFSDVLASQRASKEKGTTESLLRDTQIATVILTLNSPFVLLAQVFAKSVDENRSLSLYPRRK